jgi:trehalose/maltose hydrolase-like predicted phosphorylase
MAAMALEFANEAAVLVGGTANSTYNAIAQGLRIAFDAPNQRHLPFDDYYQVNRTVAGAEVVMLGYPIQASNITLEIRKNDYAFYSPFEYAWYWEAPRSMIFSMYAIAAAELEDTSNAQQYFSLCYSDMKAPFNVFFELMENASSGGCHNFITGYGAFLQALTYGWGRIRINESMLYMNPMLPPSSTATSIKYKKVFS